MPGNLPEELAPFVGRRRELGEVRNLLVDGLPTLIGTGGVGRPAWRLPWLRTASARFPMVSGTPTWTDRRGQAPGQLRVGYAGHRRETHGGDLAESLTRSLRDEHLLLILDNCEHLIEGAAYLVGAITRHAEDPDTGHEPDAADCR